MDEQVQVAVVGAGPAGLALAGAIARRGADVVVIDPAPHSPWRPVWSGFEDELPGVPVRHRWSTTRVDLDSGTRRFERAYIQVDKVALQRQLTEAVPRFIEGRVERFQPEGHGGVLELDCGTVRAERIVDCTGSGQVLVDNPEPRAFQTAYGIEIRTSSHPWALDEATWMDLRGLETPPTFLYAMPYASDRVFVEETALAARPPVSLEVLEERLLARLEALGVVVDEVLDTERCVIALDVTPHPHLAYGAAAGMVHPATGYLLARALALADQAAACVVDTPTRLHRLLHPPGVRKLHMLGLETLLRADGPGTSRFFEVFFEQPQWVRDGFLGSSAQVLTTTLAMSRIFVNAPTAVKWQLAAPLVS